MRRLLPARLVMLRVVPVVAETGKMLVTVGFGGAVVVVVVVCVVVVVFVILNPFDRVPD